MYYSIYFIPIVIEDYRTADTLNGYRVLALVLANRLDPRSWK
jgi:hypothetical protein